MEACIELIAFSDGVYNRIFANLPVALEHPGKLVAPCLFGPAYKSGNNPAQRAQPAEYSAAAPVVAAAVPAEAQIPIAMGMPVAGPSSSSHDAGPSSSSQKP